jgi:hypothetical protein
MLFPFIVKLFERMDFGLKDGSHVDWIQDIDINAMERK